jgi:hypothetical protein
MFGIAHKASRARDVLDCGEKNAAFMCGNAPTTSIQRADHSYD